MALRDLESHGGKVESEFNGEINYNNMISLINYREVLNSMGEEKIKCLPV